MVIFRPGSVRPGRVRPTWPSAISVLVRLLRLHAVTSGYETAEFRKTRTSTEIALGQVGRTRPGRTLPGRKMSKKISRSDLGDYTSWFVTRVNLQLESVVTLHMGVGAGSLDRMRYVLIIFVVQGHFHHVCNDIHVFRNNGVRGVISVECGFLTSLACPLA